jgi:RIO kinase 1
VRFADCPLQEVFIHKKDLARMTPEEAKAYKAAHKKAVKEKNAAKRKEKIPKHLKKKKVKATSGKK